jgi:hypothetical protein
MLITACIENREHRVYVTRFASVVSYFTSDEESGGVTLHTEPGLMTWPSEYERSVDSVRQAIIEHVATQLQIDPSQLFSVSFKDLKAIAVPDLPEHYRYARRTKNRAYPVR